MRDILATAAAVAAAATPNLMVTAASEVAANVVEAALNPPPTTQWRCLLCPLPLQWPKGHGSCRLLGKFCRGVCVDFNGIGLLATILYTPALTADAMPWSCLPKGRRRGFGGDPRERWVVLRGLILR